MMFWFCHKLHVMKCAFVIPRRRLRIKTPQSDLPQNSSFADNWATYKILDSRKGAREVLHRRSWLPTPENYFFLQIMLSAEVKSACNSWKDLNQECTFNWEIIIVILTLFTVKADIEKTAPLSYINELLPLPRS